MSWIRRMLGMTELIEQQKLTNELLTEVTRLQKLDIDNNCRVFSQRRMSDVW